MPLTFSHSFFYFTAATIAMFILCLVICIDYERRYIFCVHTGTSIQEEETQHAIEQAYSLEDLKQTFEITMRQYKEVLRDGGVTRCLQVLEEKRNEWKSQKVNIAITGRSGTGKSSFINALVKKWTGKEGPAKAGITETTKNLSAIVIPITQA